MQIKSKHMMIGMALIAILWIGLLVFLTSGSQQPSPQEVEAQIRQQYLAGSNTVTATQTQLSGEQRELKLQLNGLFCAGCAQGIKSVLTSTPGVLNADVQAPPVSEATVLYDPSIVSQEKITGLEIFGEFSAYKILQVISDKEV